MLKFIAYFTLSFAILCIPIDGRLLFEHTYRKLAPYGNSILESVKKEANWGLNKGKRFTKKLFDSAPPSMQDTVRSKLSGTKNEAQHDSYTQEEERLLRTVMEKDPSE